ncbi:MAG: UDP-N-acetylmuramoyl-L-alanine--D-glutamate ligase [Thermaerobacter sp.]|nr:UDP-N-acetylmuramoyl-L-alanine--D-glutamate ligase [Thermaerobacter sp.]
MKRDFRGRRVAVVGLGVSHRALIRFLLERGALITACDRKEAGELGEVRSQLATRGVRFVLGADYLRGLTDCDLAFLTPGMPKHLPEVEAARRRGVPLLGEAGLFLELCAAPVTGITGSAGKTTTTSLVAAILERAGRQVFLGGNIGRPLIAEVDAIPAAAEAVLELSSFQLQLVETSPQVAVLLNVTPNHLDVHRDLAEYREAKAQIFRRQQPEAVLVANRDDPGARELAETAPSRVLWFSRREELAEGAFLSDGWLQVRWEGRSQRLLPAGELALPGTHNLENALAAAGAAAARGAGPEATVAVLREFGGVPHRLEQVADSQGVRWYNDSIATTPERTLAALATLPPPLVLIAGGYDKHLDYAALGPAVRRQVRVLLLIGQTAAKIEAAVRGASGGELPVIRRLPDLAAAVGEARRLARPGDTVVLSPASASYDQFTDFEQRGERFRRLVIGSG